MNSFVGQMSSEATESLEGIIARAYAISSGYDYLRGLVQNAVGINIILVIGMEQAPMRLVVRDLFRELAVNQGRLEAMVRSAFTSDLRGNGELRLWASAYWPELLALVTEEMFEKSRVEYEKLRQDRRIVQLTADIDQIGLNVSLNPKQRDLVRGLLKRIEDLEGFKMIHDVLHDLQMSVLIELHRLAIAPLSSKDRELAVTLQVERIVSSAEFLNQSVEDFTVLGGADSSCRKIAARLAEIIAILEREPAPRQVDIMRAHVRLRGLLRQYMPSFDQHIVDTSVKVCFADLAKELRSLVRQDEDEADGQTLAARLGAAADGLDFVDSRLAWRRSAHQLWQQVDATLFNVEELLAGSGRTMELESHWIDLTQWFDGLEALSLDQSIARLRERLAPIDEAAKANFSNLDEEVTKLFAYCASQTRVLFQRADNSLRADCRALSRLRQPLQNLIGDTV